MSSDDRRRSRGGRIGHRLSLATVLGVGVGLLAAPQTGTETRRALRKRLAPRGEDSGASWRSSRSASRPIAPRGARAGRGAAPPRAQALRGGARRSSRMTTDELDEEDEEGSRRRRHRADRGRRHRRGRVPPHQRACRARARARARGRRHRARRGRGALGAVPASAAATAIATTESGTRIDPAGLRAARQPEAFPALRAPRRSRGARAAVAAASSPQVAGPSPAASTAAPPPPTSRRSARARAAACSTAPARRSAGSTYVRRVNVPLARVPRHVRAAFIAVEDRRFYYHHGVDWRSAARALVRNVARADVSEGFSTITMQVVRNAFVPAARAASARSAAS